MVMRRKLHFTKETVGVKKEKQRVKKEYGRISGFSEFANLTLGIVSQR